MSKRLSFVSALAVLLATLLQPWLLARQQSIPVTTGVPFASLDEAELREWLTYLASDALQGRRAFSEGYGLAAAFVAERLREAGVTPLGEDGTYFQTVSRRGYRVTRSSTVTVERAGETRVFRHGEHVSFAANSGGQQALQFDSVRFAGYGIVDGASSAQTARELEGQLVVWMPGTPGTAAAGTGRGGRSGGRSSALVQTGGAAAVIQFQPAPPSPGPEELAAEAAVTAARQSLSDAEAGLNAARREGGTGRRGRGGGRAGGRAAPVPDLATILPVDALVPPQFTADEQVLAFLLAGAPTPFAELRAMSDRGDPLPSFSLGDVSVTIEIDNEFDVISADLSKNVVAMVEGVDPVLKNTYVLLGAHLDHVGWQETEGAGSVRCPAAPGDIIFNGADDDASGSTALVGIAKAFARGPRPRRSVVFVWHTAEESGLLGSTYHAEMPVVPLDQVQAQLNVDMIGRNRDDDPAQENTVYLVGADRISTDLHNVIVDTNGSLAAPLTLDYQYNDPDDTESFYTRSDHYSYARKGIPVAFFFTGTHPDYHCPTDHADRILFPKLVRVADLIYRTAFNLANAEQQLRRDGRGPRAGVGFQGRLEE
jgi:hypothetical protein